MRRKSFFVAALIVFLGVMFGCSERVNTFADVIYVPEGNSFLNSHLEECEYKFSRYIVNYSKNELNVYVSPDTDIVSGKIENGETVATLYEYTDANGDRWCYMDSPVSGWMPAEYLWKVFDTEEFEKQYASSIKKDSIKLSEDVLNKKIKLFDYPGSTEYIECSVNGNSEVLPVTSLVYTDESGRQWGKIDYLYGIRSKWVYLENPLFDVEEIFEEGVPTVDNRTMAPPSSKVVIPKHGVAAWLFSGAVVLLAVCVGLLIFMLRRSAKKNKTIDE